MSMFLAIDINVTNSRNGLISETSSLGHNYVFDFGIDNTSPSYECKNWMRFRISC